MVPNLKLVTGCVRNEITINGFTNQWTTFLLPSDDIVENLMK